MNPSRRAFRFGVHTVFVAACCSALGQAAERPNILWITLEDMSPTLACYGDPSARTPNIDAFARQAVRYTHAFSTAPVCSPSRACLITGVYATSLGNPHLRCAIPIPDDFKGYGAYLRAAGYFTSNNYKTDYNLINEPAFIAQAWTRNGNGSHWRNREPGQPFMSVFNYVDTHQSRSSAQSEEDFERLIGSRLKPEQRADPAHVRVPGFYPETPAARKAMARHYDCITFIDAKVGQTLRELEADGLADDTIVFFYSDHGMGMPRGKRLLHDSGTHVPLLIRFPAKWRHLAPAESGGTTDRLVSFVDFAPTVLSLAGVPIPKHMQGTPFLGKAAGPQREFIYTARDRVDEAIDTARGVRDKRWLYLRNYRPHLSWAPPEAYSDTSTFRRELLEMARQGKAGTGPTAWLAATRPLEELYDTVADPDQLRNVASDSAHAKTLERLRAKLRAWVIETRDVALLPESDVTQRSAGRTPYEIARTVGKYPFERVLAVAELVGDAKAASKQRALLKDDDAGVRYWAAVGCRANADLVKSARAELQHALRDPSADVRIEAAGALLDQQSDAAALDVLRRELDSNDGAAILHAARTIELLGDRAKPLTADVSKFLVGLRAEEKKTNDARSERRRFITYIRFSLEAFLAAIGDPTAQPWRG
jgi:N-sulfoglucosamine sulfohydrolase